MGIPQQPVPLCSHSLCIGMLQRIPQMLVTVRPEVPTPSSFEGLRHQPLLEATSITGVAEPAPG